MRNSRIALITVVALACAALLIPTMAFADEGVFTADFTAEEGALPEGWYIDAWYDEAEDRTVSVKDGEAYIGCPIGNDVKLCYDIEVEPDTCYEIACEIKISDVQDGAGANISVLNSLATSETLTGTRDYQHVALTGVTGADQTVLTVCVRVGGYGLLSSGEAWFKDLTVTRLDEEPDGAASFSAAEAGGATGEVTETSILNFGAMVLAALVFVMVCIPIYKRTFASDNTLMADADEKRRDSYAVAVLLLGAFIVRCLLSAKFYGHSTDINCFMAWGYNLNSGGFEAFYTSGTFADYPPGYMYVLGLLGKLCSMLGLSYGSGGYALMFKLPGIFADIAAAYIVWHIAKSRLPKSAAICLSCLVAFNPAMAFISGAWGQVDQILTLLIVLTVWLFAEKKQWILAGAVYGIAIIVKPQALMAGPLLAVAYACSVIDAKQNWWKQLLRTAAAVASAVAVMILISLPFKGTQPLFWFVDKLIGTATSYGYASVEAFNLFAIFGGNWAIVDGPFLFLTYKVWGYVFIVLSVVFCGFLYCYKRTDGEKGRLTLTMALLFAMLFCFGIYMHERYLAPAILLLIIAFVMYKDKRLPVSCIWFTASLLINVLAAFFIVDAQAARGTNYSMLTVTCSLLNVGGVVYLMLAAWDIAVNKRIFPAFRSERKEKSFELPAPVGRTASYAKKEKIALAALTAVYAIVALVNLGTLQAPETVWTGRDGDTVTFDFGSEVTLSEVRVFGGLYTGEISLTADDDSEIYYSETNDDMFRWVSIGGAGITTGTFTLEVTDGKVWFNEIAFIAEDGTLLTPAATGSGNAQLLVDEPEEVPNDPSHLNGMYFDELYHARTAYEHLYGLEPYENSHPPLGKVFIMLGIAVFGMNAFGWRIVGTLVGIAMVPIMYAFARRIFKRWDYAFVASALFAFDFMHFTQTRIATIDVYGVFFIMLMFLFMYKYYEMNFFVDGFKKTLLPLGLAGLFFGLGAASKWICIYAGGGLAVILFISLYKRYKEYRVMKASDDETLRKKAALFPKYVIKTLLWCLLFYIAVPVAIYIASYLPYYLCVTHYDLEGMWGVQEFMFNYHSNLTATHGFASEWWKWPMILRPIWYHVDYTTASGGVETMSAMGNPAVWWICSIGTIALIIRRMNEKIEKTPAIFVLLVGVAANFMPWMLVTRCTFIYHYFASVPFIILCTLYLLKDIEEKYPQAEWVKWVWLGVAIALFALFYPVISGLAVSTEYIHALEWLPSWSFLGV